MPCCLVNLSLPSPDLDGLTLFDGRDGQNLVIRLDLGDRASEAPPQRSRSSTTDTATACRHDVASFWIRLCRRMGGGHSLLSGKRDLSLNRLSNIQMRITSIPSSVKSAMMATLQTMKKASSDPISAPLADTAERRGLPAPNTDGPENSYDPRKESALS
jgi:hypothetical protein